MHAKIATWVLVADVDVEIDGTSSAVIFRVNATDSNTSTIQGFTRDTLNVITDSYFEALFKQIEWTNNVPHNPYGKPNNMCGGIFRLPSSTITKSNLLRSHPAGAF